MANKTFVGTEICAMRDFWIDCYSTAIFSMLLSYCDIDHEYIYNNNYLYWYDVNEAKNLGRVYIKMQIDELVNGLLLDKKEHDFVNCDDFVKEMKECFDLGRVVMLGIDMFYGISDTFQWQRHHIRHYILVEGYNDETQEFYLMETGETGYKEYIMSYSDLERAARGFSDLSYSYKINHDFKGEMYSLDDVRENAKKVIGSIDNVLSHVKDIWFVEEKYILSMRDEIDTHLKSMANRQHANSLLFGTDELAQAYPGYKECFLELEEKYWQLRSFVLKACTEGRYYECEAYIKNEFRKLMKKEKGLWEKVCLVQNYDVLEVISA